MTLFASATLGNFEDRIRRRLGDLEATGVVKRLWKGDTALWTDDPDGAREASQRLGWLEAPEQGLSAAGSYREFAGMIRDAGILQVVLLGMGGSSLCPEVLRKTFPAQGGYPKLAVLDSTEPGSILGLESSIPLDHTLFLVSTKSGTTIETLSFYRYFWERIVQMHARDPAQNFVAITDPGTSLESEAENKGFRRVFSAPPTVGGRYSALTPFGLVPAALLGIDLDLLLGSAVEIKEECRAAGESNPGLVLGAMMAELALAGRDKLTVVVDPAISSFGLWLEQLIAESLGKEGKGIIPIADEPLGSSSMYGDDRTFVYLAVGEGRPDYHEKLVGFAGAGHPVIRLRLENPYHLGAQFFLWEFATAVAGVVFHVNAFDQPNVAESKQYTSNVLSQVQTTGRFASEVPLARSAGVELLGPPGSQPPRQTLEGEDGLIQHLGQWLESLPPNSYLALQAYLPVDEAVETLLQTLRVQLRERYRLATTLGMGPRYLHSTGQLHKGGPKIGAFLQLTSESDAEVPVPGQDFSFETLVHAQALGDAQSLAEKDLPLLRIHLASVANISRLGAWVDRLTPTGPVPGVAK